MKAPLEHQAVKIESQCNKFCVCGVLELVPPRILLKSAPSGTVERSNDFSLQLCFHKVFFSSRLVRGTHLRSAPSDRGSRGAPGAPPSWAWGVKSPRGTEAGRARGHGAKGQVRNTGAHLTAYGPHCNLHLTHTSQTQKTASVYLE